MMQEILAGREASGMTCTWDEFLCVGGRVDWRPLTADTDAVRSTSSDSRDTWAIYQLAGQAAHEG